MSSSPADWRTFELTLVPLLLLSLLSLLLLFFHPDVKKSNIANFTFNHRLHRPPRLLPFTLSVVIIVVVVILSSSLRRQSKVGPGCFTNLPTARQQRQIPVCREGNLEPSLESSSSRRPSSTTQSRGLSCSPRYAISFYLSVRPYSR